MVDHLEIEIEGGRGGNGAVSFLREKYKPKGPPDGGDGGKGGDVSLIGDPNLLTLYDLSSRRHYYANAGESGGRRLRHGKNAIDLSLAVPFGTEVSLKEETGEVKMMGEILKEGDKLLIARGGLGGKGNARFKSSTNRSPKMAEEGRSGEHRRIVLDLKILADVGLIGLPNAGKSTLLNALTKAHSKVASYPFTTLDPQLGVLMEGNKRLVLADIPGLIEGASFGRGLGDKFLRHIERVGIIVHLIDPSVSNDLVRDYEVVRKELKDYSPLLLKKRELVLLTKSDLDLDDSQKKALERLKTHLTGLKVRAIRTSSLSYQGLEELVESMLEMSEKEKSKSIKAEKVKKKLPTYETADLGNKRIVFGKGIS